MKNLLLIISVVLSSQGCFAVAADISILFNPKANASSRDAVSKLLAERLGREGPLSVTAATAELCHGVDLCASASSETDLENTCAGSEEEEKDLALSSTCFAKKFKKNFSCDETKSPQTVHTLAAYGEALKDFQTTYMSRIESHFKHWIANALGIDINVLEAEYENDPIAFGQNSQYQSVIEIMLKESSSMGQYTLNCFEKIAPIMYSRDQKKLTRYYNLINGVLNTMERMPIFSGKVNRGTNLPQSVLKEYHKVGNVVCSDGFTSTSIHIEKDYGSKPRNAFLKSKCTQRLYISQGVAEAAKGRSISDISVSRSENEILFPPGTCFRVDSVRPRTDESSPDEEDYECQEGEHFQFELTVVPNPKL